MSNSTIFVVILIYEKYQMFLLYLKVKFGHIYVHQHNVRRQFSNLAEGFLAIAKAEPDRCAVVDATGSLDEVEARVWASVQDRLAVGG